MTASGIGATTGHTEFAGTAVQDFRACLRGELLCPGDEGYDAARKVFNAMIDRRPAMIARCAGAADVVSAVNFARSYDLPVAVRGGGHSVAGKAVCDGGLMIDLSLMKGIRVDPARRSVRAQPGLRLGEFDRETQGFGLATTLGIVTDTGIAGLTLGGGIGWLNGKYGLACDNLVSVDVVTADGRLLTASESENADLFWGVRGSGGNLGIVTSFEYRLHPLGPVLGGMVAHPLDKAKNALRSFFDLSAQCPDELTTMPTVLTLPDGTLGAALVVCYCGAITDGEGVLKSVRSFGSPVADSIQPVPYVALQSALDPGFPQGRYHYWKGSFARKVSDDTIEIILDFMARKPSPFTLCYFQQVHGAAGRVAPADTAFCHRGTNLYEFSILSQWDDPAATETNVTWTRAFFDALAPHLDKGVYVNSLGDEGEERVRAAFGANYERLVALKKKYDPTNFFRMNQNIRPA